MAKAARADFMTIFAALSESGKGILVKGGVCSACGELSAKADSMAPTMGVIVKNMSVMTTALNGALQDCVGRFERHVQAMEEA